MLDGLRGHDTALVIFQFAIQLVSQLASGSNHHIKSLLRTTRAWQAKEEADCAGAEMVDVVQIEYAGLDRIGHREQHFAVASHAFVTVENVHFAKTQTAFQNILQQRWALEAAFVARDNADDQYFFYRWQVLVFGDALGRLVIRKIVVTRREQARAVQIKIQIALLRLILALLVTPFFAAGTALVVTRVGAHRRQIMLVKLRLLVRVQHTRRAEHFGRRGFFFIRKVGEAPIQPEFQFALAAAHTAPAIKENTGNDYYADDDQPLAQTDFHVIQCL
ncbi:hypothetical protein KPSA1_05114 [Pseudomonas syringae pv. actinidiae]|uniref:Uncharacterized protein n=1 Tax=Pseudomonas syringae pv. actinidiae TaxID=103796 RepID=A0A2V0QFE0_PSESF|nr:hypothetical protein KPSA1_05114 [Pseudomonas syringae pv. actinidiae]